MDGYLTPGKAAESEYDEKKSVFLGHLLPIQSEDEAKRFVAEMKKKYADARHNVWAYALPDGTVRSSDDGEPSGTGGAPVLDAIVKRGLTGCVIVVTRYFGGILLGTGGLVRAYSGAAGAALDSAGSARMTVYKVLSLRCSYAQYGGVTRLAERHGCAEIRAQFGEDVEVTMLILPQKLEAFGRELRDQSGGTLEAEAGGEVYRKE